ncbi:MAG: hypothetical protein WAL64_01480 [Candidatus Dormiibacterota bacterium]
MKGTVYVPDDLWADAVAAHPDANPSQVVQAGLRALLLTPEGLGYAEERPQELAPEFEAAVSRLREDARKEFSSGYRHAVRVSQAMPWHIFEELVDVFHFDVKRWVEDDLRPRIESSDGARFKLEEGTSWAQFIRELDDGFGCIPLGPGSSLEVPSSAHADGFRQAMRDLWASIRRPENANSSDASE